MPAHGNGPIPAKVMIIGEAWGAEEERLGKPFVGPSGMELDRMLHEAGMLRSECFASNLINRRPPNNDLSHWIPIRKSDVTSQHVVLRDKHVLPSVYEGYDQLMQEITLVKPNIIVACGNYSMWALTGKWGIMNWRGSQLYTDSGIKVIPTIHPALVLREWSHRSDVITDLRRVKRHSLYEGPYNNTPDYRFIIRPSFNQVIETLRTLQRNASQLTEKIWIDFDIETRVGHIECFSISWSRLDAVCVPIMSYDGTAGYWSLEEETQIIWEVQKLLRHPNVRVRWQNGLYDAQYTYRWWLFIPRGGQDTMISQHAVFSDKPKALHYQASLYADYYVFWKEEGKHWNPKMPPEQRWRYNCLDCVYTREVGEVEAGLVEKFKLHDVHEFQQAMFWPVLKAMNRGIRIIEGNAKRLDIEVSDHVEAREKFLEEVLGFYVNINSPKQMMDLFYEVLKQPAIWTRPKKGNPSHKTCDDEALQTIGKREPLLQPITACIADIRTLKKFLKDFIRARRDADGRMRCSFNIGGSESGKTAPKTYRLSSSENPFGSGANLQTIPSEKSKSVGKWEARQRVAAMGDPISLPNLRSMFGPDPGYTFFDMDLNRADLMVMAWDAGDKLLKEALKIGVDIHLLNAFVLDGKEPPALDELVETHPKYQDFRGPRKHKREFAKVFCHATDYLGKARTVAAHTGRTIAETERAQRIYLGTYKGIKQWQDRVIEQVKRHRFVENKFGYRWYIFDRINDQVMPEAVAWIPQSTVSIVINKIWMNIYKNLPEVEVLLQVHDSLAGQFPSHRKEALIPAMKKESAIVVPYDDPLIIPTGIHTSEVSWGDC